MAHRLYWSDCAGDRNLGDQLGPAILDHYEVPYERTSAAEASLITCGSIIDALPREGWNGTILGSGTLHAGTQRDLSKARILAVRGARTRDRLGLSANVRLGDLGLLAPHLIDRRPSASVATGIFPHYADRELATRFVGTPISAVRGPGVVVSSIAACKRIITSSLHVLIVADALGIPHMLVPSDAVAGGLHKFHDYASGLGYEGLTAKRWRLSDRRLIRNAQRRLERAIAAL